MTPEEVLQYIKEHNIEIIDLKFNDLPGLWQHFSMSAEELTEMPPFCTYSVNPPGHSVVPAYSGAPCQQHPGLLQNGS